MDVQDFIVNRDQHMRPLEYDLSENFNALLRYMQDAGILDNVPVGTTSESEIVSISDAYPAPPRALNVYGASTQNGTPTPDVPVPIKSVDALTAILSGWNLFDIAKVNTNVHTVTGTTIKAGGSTAFQDFYSGASMTSTKTYSVAEVENMLYLPAGTYTLKVASASNAIECYYVDPDTRKTGRELVWNVTQKTFTLDKGGYIVLTVRNAGSTVTDLQINAGSMALSYTPFTVGITTVPDLLPEGTSLRSLPDGTKDTLNLSYLRPSTRAGWAWYSREVVQVVGENTIANTCNWMIDTNPQVFLSRNFVSDMAGASHPSGRLVMCDKLAAETARAYSLVSSMADNSICKRGSLNKLFVKTGVEYGSVDNFLSALGDALIIYPLDTPVTTTLDPIELPMLPAPNATVWCDGGNATPTLVLEYVRDTNATIAELSEAIADIVSG